MLPGPVTRSTGSHSPAPWGNNAIALGPPTADTSPTPHQEAGPTEDTSSTPSRAHAARMVGAGSPPCSFCGELARAMDPTPATCAGTTFITTLETSGARPPGT